MTIYAQDAFLVVFRRKSVGGGVFLLPRQNPDKTLNIFCRYLPSRQKFQTSLQRRAESGKAKRHISRVQRRRRPFYRIYLNHASILNSSHLYPFPLFSYPLLPPTNRSRLHIPKAEV